MATIQRSRLNHEAPYWIREDEEVFFVTVCCRDRASKPLLRPGVAAEILDSVKHRHKKGEWWCGAFVVMPDHVHGLVGFPGPKSMQHAMRDWKSWTARSTGVAWQRGWFDHRLRTDECWRSKARYLCDNPVRAGLVNEADDWPWFFWDSRW